MKKYHYLLSALLLAILLVTGGCERKVTYETYLSEANDYVGSEACAECHITTYQDFLDSGHPYILNAAADVRAGGYYPAFVPDLPGPPPGREWSSISYVIGGFRWRANFLDSAGYPILGSQAQWNMPGNPLGLPGEWDYFMPSGRTINCARCHTTGYQQIPDRVDLPGVIGSWALDGVQCEACHGPGQHHLENPGKVDMIVDRSAAACGRCHARDTGLVIAAHEGFIANYCQWTEIRRTGHIALACVDCHDPHIGLHPSAPDRPENSASVCEKCHYAETRSYAESSLPHFGASVTCLDCHMPYAVKSAVGDTNQHLGDIRSHLMRINTDPNAVLISNQQANGYLTLDFTCLTPGCHDDKTKAWAASAASQVHQFAENYLSCFRCHSWENESLVIAENGWQESKHASGDNTIWNRNTAPAYEDCEKCHTHEGFTAAISDSIIVGDTFSVIGCFTCHREHDSGPLQMRVTGLGELANGTLYDYQSSNTCGACHLNPYDVGIYVTDNITLETTWGPHYGPQMDMLLGQNAYKFPGYAYNSSYHTFSVPEGCRQCHLTEAEGDNLWGHSLAMRSGTEENVFGCNAAAPCHAGEVSTFNILPVLEEDFDWDGTIEGVQDEVDGLLDSLRILLTAAGLLDNDRPVDGRLVTEADSSGALFNYLFVKADGSRGIHNTKFATRLLRSAIDYLTPSTPAATALNPQRFEIEMRSAHAAGQESRNH